MGCNHMTCTQCLMHWCWVCGRPWQPWHYGCTANSQQGSADCSLMWPKKAGRERESAIYCDCMVVKDRKWYCAFPIRNGEKWKIVGPVRLKYQQISFIFLLKGCFWEGEFSTPFLSDIEREKFNWLQLPEGRQAKQLIQTVEVAPSSAQVQCSAIAMRRELIMAHWTWCMLVQVLPSMRTKRNCNMYIYTTSNSKYDFV